MLIIGIDYHPSFQQSAFLDQETRRVNQVMTKGNYGSQAENTRPLCAQISMTLRDATT
jgi:hypothetical protein